ncbi:MAG: L-alanine-DL-glutamate epimerase [Planctomycetes bacterium]|nr:L-alanine-DL-glutamate epimerase [Planctomycetota bacterium]
MRAEPAPLRIAAVHVGHERLALRQPVGFKGGSLRELWQSAVSLRGAGAAAYGTGIQSVLWSDAAVAARHGEAGGNRLMLETTAHAAELAVGAAWREPPALLAALLAPAHDYACQASGMPALRRTFTLNALVPLDVAAWALHARARGLARFDDLLPARVRPWLGCRHRELALVPLVAYGTPLAEVAALLRAGHGMLKIKLGSDPAGDGDRAAMLAWDCRRLEDIHRLADRHESAWTVSGRVLYYLDANGRYDSPERVEALLAHARRIGALERIALFEEPFPEESRQRVDDFGVRVAADESAHGPAEVVERIALGYGAIALKPVAKTPSLSLAMLAAAGERGVPCFCADLTVDPLLRTWNQNVAARLPALPGMRTGLVESNGWQNLAGWDGLVARHPCAGAPWLEPRAGAFRLDDGYFAGDGGLLAAAPAWPGPGQPW